MLKSLLLSVLVLSGCRALAATAITGAQLEQLLIAAHGGSDPQLANRISHLVLTERLSGERLARCESSVSGPRARLALTALTDVAEFLDLSPSEIPPDPRPDIESQRKMMQRTITYVATTVKQLPNLFATRVTRSFQDHPRLDTGLDLARYEQFHHSGTHSEDVLYRQNEEQVNSTKLSARGDTPLSLTTRGEFGSILVTVLIDAAHGNLSWSHWEQGSSGPIAVFRFNIAADKSHYDVSFCCTWSSSGIANDFHRIAGYQGEIAINPATGEVFRVSLRATGLKRPDPILSADILVEYAPRQFGGKTYIFPVKGIALSLAAQSITMAEAHALSIIGGSRPMQVTLNDVTFEQYHLFTGKSRLLTGSSDDSPATPR